MAARADMVPSSMQPRASESPAGRETERAIAQRVRALPALCDPRALAMALGLEMARSSSARVGAAGVLVRCPWHAERTPSCSLFRASDLTLAVKCHGCGVSGDALTLIEAVRRTAGWRATLAEAAELGGDWSLAAELRRERYERERGERGERSGQRERVGERVASPGQRAAPAQTRAWPPVDEVQALWTAAEPAAEARGEPSWWLAVERRIDVDALEDQARVLTRAQPLPRWARWHGHDWRATGHVVICPVFDATGQHVSVRACRIEKGVLAAEAEPPPKRLPPAGHRSAGGVLANREAVELLRAGADGPARLLIVTEGETDWMARTAIEARAATDAAADAAAHAAARTGKRRRQGRHAAVLGLYSGSWTEEHAARVPNGSTVVIRTDTDEPGDRYAVAVARSLAGRCDVRAG